MPGIKGSFDASAAKTLEECEQLTNNHGAMTMTMAMAYLDDRIYLVHEKTIRDEHQALAGQIDRICRLLGSTPQNTGEVIVTLQEVLKMAKALFRHEDTLMKISDFSGRLNHARDHAFLIKGLGDCIGSYVDESEPISPSIGEYLRIWLPYHEKKYDHAFLEFLKA